MRKFLLTRHNDPYGFVVKVKLVERTDNGVITLFDEVLEQQSPKYRAEQQQAIDMCNKLLSDKGKERLTEKEIEFMLDPEGFDKRLKNTEEKMKDPEALRAPGWI